MAQKNLDVVGIGNAIIDALAHVEVDFLKNNLPADVQPYAMTLITETQADEIYGSLKNCTIMPGGSAANSIASFAALGGRAGYIGKVANDQLGQIFTHDFRALGIEFHTKPLEGGPATARCMSMITPDAQRTMCTYLGASVVFDEKDVDEALIARANLTYLEGYLFDDQRAKAAYTRAAELTHRHGGRIALSLSDPFCVHRHREDFLRLIHDHVDVLFANEEEMKVLLGSSDVDAAHAEIAEYCDIAVVTLGKNGSQIISNGEKYQIAVVEPTKLVDTTGAGDAYAAGFLYGLSQGHSLADCGRMGSQSAARIIAHIGARPTGQMRA